MYLLYMFYMNCCLIANLIIYLFSNLLTRGNNCVCKLVRVTMLSVFTLFYLHFYYCLYVNTVEFCFYFGFFCIILILMVILIIIIIITTTKTEELTQNMYDI